MKSIWDTRFTKKKLAMDAAVKNAFVALDEWITINGAHVELNDKGEIISGAGGNLRGGNYAQAKAARQENDNDRTSGMLTEQEIERFRTEQEHREKAESQKGREKAFAENKSKRDKEMAERGKALKAELEKTGKQARALSAQIKRGEDGKPLSGQEDLVNKWEKLVDKVDKIDYQLEHETYRYGSKDAFKDKDLPEVGLPGDTETQTMHNLFDALNTDIALARERGDKEDEKMLKELGKDAAKEYDSAWWTKNKSSIDKYSKTGKLYESGLVKKF